MGIILPIFLGIMISQYKDPYKPIRISWFMSSKGCVVHVANVAHLRTSLLTATTGRSTTVTGEPFFVNPVA